jgi:anti-sigma B factor antagonist
MTKPASDPETPSTGGEDQHVAFEGDLDLNTADPFVNEVLAKVAGSPATLIIDFAAVTFCDSAGINGLVRIRRRCQEAGWEMRIVNMRPHTRRVIDLTGLGEYLGVADAAAR